MVPVHLLRSHQRRTNGRGQVEQSFGVQLRVLAEVARGVKWVRGGEGVVEIRVAEEL